MSEYTSDASAADQSPSIWKPPGRRERRANPAVWSTSVAIPTKITENPDRSPISTGRARADSAPSTSAATMTDPGSRTLIPGIAHTVTPRAIADTAKISRILRAIAARLPLQRRRRWNWVA